MVAANQYYVIQTSLSYSSTALTEARVWEVEHEDWVRDAERDGRLFLGGDFMEGREGGDYDGDGIAEEGEGGKRKGGKEENDDEGSVSSTLVPDRMYVIRSPSLGEAEKFANTDPFNRNCVTTYRVAPWKVTRGRVGVEVRMGDGEFRREEREGGGKMAF